MRAVLQHVRVQRRPQSGQGAKEGSADGCSAGAARHQGEQTLDAFFEVIRLRTRKCIYVKQEAACSSEAVRPPRGEAASRVTGRLQEQEQRDAATCLLLTLAAFRSTKTFSL